MLKSPCFQTLPAAGISGENNAEQLQIRCYIVEAAEQAIDDTPSKRSLELLRLLHMTDPETQACVPAGIGMIKKHPHDGLSVTYVADNQTVKNNCSTAIALVIVYAASRSDSMRATR